MLEQLNVFLWGCGGKGAQDGDYIETLLLLLLLLLLSSSSSSSSSSVIHLLQKAIRHAVTSQGRNDLMFRGGVEVALPASVGLHVSVRRLRLFTALS